MRNSVATIGRFIPGSFNDAASNDYCILTETELKLLERRDLNRESLDYEVASGQIQVTRESKT